MNQKLMPSLGNYALCEENSIVILDNATIHHSEEIVNLIESRGAKIIHLPPYSPDLNPIELMFGVYKSALKRFYNEKLSVAHTFALQAVTSVTANNFFSIVAYHRFKNCLTMTKILMQFLLWWQLLWHLLLL